MCYRVSSVLLEKRNPRGVWARNDLSNGQERKRRSRLPRSASYSVEPTIRPFLDLTAVLNYGGILATDQEARATLESYLEELAASKEAHHVELRHQNLVATSWVRSDRKVSMRLPLPPSYEELLKGFRQNCVAGCGVLKKKG